MAAAQESARKGELIECFDGFQKAESLQQMFLLKKNNRDRSPVLVQTEEGKGSASAQKIVKSKEELA